MKRAEMLEILEGCEIRTLLYETELGVLAIEDGQVVADGKVLDRNVSTANLRLLWDDFVNNEFGGSYV